MLSEPENRVDRPQGERQLERILNSRTFQAAPQLRKFLEYVGTAALQGRGDEIKEYTIGTNVFGRQDFDPRTDTFVRTQASRLRSRLEGYYREEGTADEVLVEMPRGSYVPRFARRDGETAIPEPPPPEVRGRPYWLLAAGILAGFGLAVVAQWLARPAAQRGPASQLWSRFVEGQAGPIVCFSNHASLINETQDQLYYYGQDTMPKGTEVHEQNLPARDRRLLKELGPVYFNDGTTGTGEVMAVANLARTFAQLGSPMIVKRARLLSSADLNRSNVIFVGAPTAHPLLREVRPGGEFEFDRAGAELGLWGGRILNRHPRSGESAAYGVERDPATRALRADHALVSVMPGIAPGRKLAVLAGITTEGTQAAADFATSAAGLQQISAHLGERVLASYFQVVVRVEIASGDVLRIQYVTGRAVQSGL